MSTGHHDQAELDAQVADQPQDGDDEQELGAARGDAAEAVVPAVRAPGGGEVTCRTYPA